MGRSHNSFTTWVGHAAETVSEDRVSLPEKDLWVAVLCRAALDACKSHPQLDMNSTAKISHHNHYKYDREAARHFFMEGGTHFRLICELAGRNPDYVQRKVKKIILRKNGWNVDVPITSRYRQGPKRGRKGKYRQNMTLNIGSKGGKAGFYGV